MYTYNTVHIDNHLLFLCSDDIIRSLEQIGHFVLTISLDLMKSPEVRKAGDRSIYQQYNVMFIVKNFFQ